MTIWTIYDHPTDYPDDFVARRWEVTGEGTAPTDELLTCNRLDAIQTILRGFGFVRLPRAEHDDPKILETWL